jgi:hypothetical protein
VREAGADLKVAATKLDFLPALSKAAEDQPSG